MMCSVRLWSLHPEHLDRQGLTGCWREALLAQAVLAGRTRGYRSHSQLVRFREHPQPLTAIGAYLDVLADEATRRGYRFDRSRIGDGRDVPEVRDGALGSMPVAEGQVAYEWEHLRAKVAVRSPDWAEHLAALESPGVHPLFEVVPGGVAQWERVAG